MRRPALSVLVLVLVATGCGDSPDNAVTRDDVAILESVLVEICNPQQDRYSAISDLPGSADLSGKIPAEWHLPDSLTAGISRRATLGLKWPRVTVCDSQRQVDGQKVNTLIERSVEVPRSWRHLYAEYPGLMGLIQVSLPAYSVDRNQSIVFIESDLEVWSNAGFLFWLERNGEVWRVREMHRLWISSF